MCSRLLHDISLIHALDDMIHDMYVCVCSCLRMATKQGDGVEKRKHLTTTSAQRKEKSQKTSKTYSKVNDVITNTTTTEKKNTVFCSLSIVFLGRVQLSMSNIRSEMYHRCSTRDLSYGVVYTWGFFMSAVRIVKVGAMFDVVRFCIFLKYYQSTVLLARRNLIVHLVFVTCCRCLA